MLRKKAAQLSASYSGITASVMPKPCPRCSETSLVSLILNAQKSLPSKSHLLCRQPARICIVYLRIYVRRAAKAHLIYEDAEYHNAVFVGLDSDGIARHAHKRSTNSEGKSFRQNVEGSDPKHSFNYTGTDGSLYVFEAPIDLLSYISLYPSDWQSHSYVACCGTSIQPVLEQLRRQDIDSVYLCLDNDSAGQKAAQRMEAELSERGVYVEIVVPTLKDWNDDLRREEQEWTQTSGLSL